MQTIQLGKNGVTESFLKELKKRLTKEEVVKVNILPAALEEHDKQYYEDLLNQHFEKCDLLGKTITVQDSR